MGLPSASTDKLPMVVTATQCIWQPIAPQHGCGVTMVPVVQAGRPLIRTLSAPGKSANPPAMFGSPILTAGGIILSCYDLLGRRSNDSSSGFNILGSYIFASFCRHGNINSIYIDIFFGI